MALLVSNFWTYITAKLKSLFDDLGLLELTFWLLIIGLTHFLFLSDQSQLRAIWRERAGDYILLEPVILPFAALFSLWVFFSSQGRVRRSLTFLIAFFPSVVFILISLPKMDFAWVVGAVVPLAACLLASVYLALKDRLGVSCATSIIIFILSWLIPLTAFALFGGRLSSALGSRILLLVFLANMMVTFSCILALPGRARLVALIPLLGLMLNELEHPSQMSELPAATDNTFQANQAFLHWLARRGDVAWYAKHNRPYPVFIVSSEGGGGFAAAHASGFLRSVQTRCPSFGQHLFALIGVSGGAVGNAEFHRFLDEEADPNGLPRSELKGSVALHSELEEWKPCNGDAAIDGTFAVRDHLAPILGSMLFDELVRRAFWLPSGERNRSTELAASFETGIAKQPFLQHFWTFYPEVDRILPNGLPAIIQVTTNMETGHIYPFSPFTLETTEGRQYFSDFKVAHLKGEDVTLASATVASASFPYMSPSMQISYLGEDGKPRRRLLVDGGYADNSGALTARLLAQSIHALDGRPFRLDGTIHGRKMLAQLGDFARLDEVEGGIAECELVFTPKPLDHVDWSGCRFHFSISHVLIRSLSDDQTTKKTKSNFFLDPLRAIFSVRSGRSEQEVSAMLREVCLLTECGLYFLSEDTRSEMMHPFESTFLNGQFLVSIFTPEAVGLPLGWSMPRDGIEVLHDRILEVESLQRNSVALGSEVCLSCITRSAIEMVLTESNLE